MKALICLGLLVLASGCASTQAPKSAIKKDPITVWVVEDRSAWLKGERDAWENRLASSAQSYCQSDSYMYETVRINAGGRFKIEITCK